MRTPSTSRKLNTPANRQEVSAFYGISEEDIKAVVGDQTEKFEQVHLDAISQVLKLKESSGLSTIGEAMNLVRNPGPLNPQEPAPVDADTAAAIKLLTRTLTDSGILDPTLKQLQTLADATDILCDKITEHLVNGIQSRIEQMPTEVKEKLANRVAAGVPELKEVTDSLDSFFRSQLPRVPGAHSRTPQLGSSRNSNGAALPSSSNRAN
jgi:hypothetical protein